MDVKEAVQRAKRHIDELFADEGIENLGLEEVVFDDVRNVWKVTIGFSRPWERVKQSLKVVLEEASGPWAARPEWKRRSFKVVEIDDGTGRVVSMTHRSLAAAN